MKKILVSVSIIAAVAAVVVGATTAYFSDTETSIGNTFTAGAIDLGIDNSSYYNGIFSEGTSWGLNYDLDNDCPNPFFDESQEPSDENPETIPCLFFNFSDLKPGDWGEDTISLRVNNNDAWACVDVTLTGDYENDVVEPESDLEDDVIYGELADHVNFIWWADDGDNVLENDEELLPSGPLGVLDVGDTATVPLASPQGGIFGSEPLTGEKTYYIGKAWCFGELSTDPVGQGDNDPEEDSGVLCNGANVTNISQSDSMTADITFRAEQSRNNDDFVCVPEELP